ncbi:MAG: SUMF1/EgtB/PvdO family nonheme iron enzyme [Chitinophagaceae bacterium]
MKRIFGNLALAVLVTTLISSCGGKKSSNLVSSKTGWNYNDSKFGGFDVPRYEGQYIGPGLVFVEGGRFTMGQTEEDLTYENNNVPRTVTVSSFFMDETEVSNLHYREYTYWLGRTMGSDFPEIYQRSLPDTQCWRNPMQYNEPMVELYFRHAAYNNYPVVGVSWEQASEYCQWRTDRVNELILIQKGYLKKNPFQVSDNNFNTRTYVAGQYDGEAGIKKKDLDPTGGGKRNIRYEDGILIPDYRLPTEAEWEYAALAYKGRNPEPDTKRRRGEEVVTDRQVYTWGDNLSTREGLRNQYQGMQLANFKRGKGDAMGVAGGLNDNADFPTEIYSYKPNAFGLYNMAGNVNEWVMDVYRPNTPMDAEDFRPFRGNVFDTYMTLEDFTLEEKDSTGKLVKRPVTSDELNPKRVDYRQSNVISYLDGDSTSQAYYDYEKTTLISNKAHVYKGGSWNDRAYWLSPGTRRYLQAHQTSSTIGFRCCMDRLGSPSLKGPGGNHFIGSKKKAR